MTPTEIISVVIPAHNEAAGIHAAVTEISRHLDCLNLPFELIIVDDGSVDGTWNQISNLSEKNEKIKGIRLSRNFGKEAAMFAGISEAQGNAVVTIDADLQHPPSLIPEMVAKWRSGAQVVHAVKRSRATDTLFVRVRATMFYKMLYRFGGFNLQNSSDYKLLDRRVVDCIVCQLPERQRFYRGLVFWVGGHQEYIYYDVNIRRHGYSKWTIHGLIKLATTATVSFTSAPLHIVTVLGIVTLVFGVVVASEAMWSWVAGTAVSGFVTLIITLLFVGSMIMISLGVIGEYIARIYEEIKCRPIFVVIERTSSGSACSGTRQNQPLEAGSGGWSRTTPPDPNEPAGSIT